MVFNIIKLLLAFVICIVTVNNAQNIYGWSGILRVPEAGTPVDGSLSIGSNIISKRINSFGHNSTDGYLSFVNLTFLPSLELNFSVTRLFNPYIRKQYGENQAIGDRSVNVKIRVLNEEKFFINSSMGVYNLIAAFGGEKAIHNHSAFVVIDKNIELNASVKIKIILGYGINIFKNASSMVLNGPFLGTEFKLFNSINFLSEYDGKHSNGGVRISFFDHISILGGFLQYKYFSGGASFSFVL